MIVMFLALTKDQNTLAIALLIPILGVLSPLLVAAQINRNTKAQKKLDWAREDEVATRAAEVAEKAAEAAQLVVDRQIVLDKKTEEVAKELKNRSDGIDTQLEKIHGLVNSQMTQAIRSELDATRDTLAMMSELITNNRSSGIEPSIEMTAAFRGRELKIKELEETLRIREEADVASKLVNSVSNQVVEETNTTL